MRIGVIVTYQGTMDFESWFDDTNKRDDCIENWHNCANAIISYAKKEKEHYQIEVFLFIRFDFWHEIKTLKSYLKIIHQNTFLSNEIYLVVDRRIGDKQKIEEASLIRFFDDLTNLHFFDILQTDVETGISDINTTKLAILKSLADISRERKVILEEMLVESNSWSFDLVWAEKLSGFLHKCPNLLLESKTKSNLNTVVVLHKNWNDFNKKSIKRLVEANNGKTIIAVCTITLDKNLESFAIENNVHIIRFSGYFDTRYFLHLYNYYHQNRFDDNLDNNSFDLTFDYTQQDESGKIFFKGIAGSDNATLITSAFDPNNFDVYNYLLNPLASKAFSELFSGYNENRFIIPIVTIDNLTVHLTEMPLNLLVWAHFGHGKETGLQSFDKTYYSTEKWLESFQGLGKSLRLAFFFSCESAGIAEKFRDAGVRIAIGFAKKVLMEDCMKLARIIIPLALIGKSDEEILRVFEDRCKSLGQDYWERCNPHIFISN